MIDLLVPWQKSSFTPKHRPETASNYPRKHRKRKARDLLHLFDCLLDFGKKTVAINSCYGTYLTLPLIKYKEGLPLWKRWPCSTYI